MVALKLRDRGQLTFPEEIGGWRQEFGGSAPFDLTGERLCWRRYDGVNPTAEVQVILPDGPPRRAEDLLAACVGATWEDPDAGLNLVTLRFGESVRLGKWAPATGSTDVVLALIGSACELVLTASGMNTHAANLNNLYEVAAGGRLGALPRAEATR
ncbi:hypothetical protein [Phenylobacterium conjunctum]|uniref:Uncharacterized protein n=1 Tax=Phenylobacterium conjunctum TaxID=1298959 RepID=A0ABW3SYB2_9CAUL